MSTCEEFMSPRMAMELYEEIELSGPETIGDRRFVKLCEGEPLVTICSQTSADWVIGLRVEITADDLNPFPVMCPEQGLKEIGDRMCPKVGRKVTNSHPSSR